VAIRALRLRAHGTITDRRHGGDLQPRQGEVVQQPERDVALRRIEIALACPTLDRRRDLDGRTAHVKICSSAARARRTAPFGSSRQSDSNAASQ
jgi:hypothetical protein